MKFLWVLTIISCLLGAIALFFGLLADSAPKQSALFALACAFAVVPYVFMRAGEALINRQRDDAVNAIVQALAELQKAVEKSNRG